MLVFGQLFDSDPSHFTNEFGLHIWNVGETDIDALGLKKWAREKVVSVECGTPQVF